MSRGKAKEIFVQPETWRSPLDDIVRKKELEAVEATMEGLAFPSPHSRVAGSEEAGRTLLEGNPCLGFPSNARFALCLPSKEHDPMNPFMDMEIDL